MRNTKPAAQVRAHSRVPARVLALLASGIFLWSLGPPVEAQEGTRELTRRPSDASQAQRSPTPAPRKASPRPPSGGSGGTKATSGYGGGGYSRGHRGYGYRGSRHYYGYSYRYPYYPSYRYRYYPYYSYSYGYPYFYGYYGGQPGYGYASYDMGALDLDVRPKKAEVYLDGNYIGLVDKYDGFPRYLWLGKGTYEIAFYRDGYETVSRQVTVYPGVVIDIKDRLSPGASVRPEPREPQVSEREQRGDGDTYSTPAPMDRRSWQRQKDQQEVYEERRRRQARRQRPSADLRSEPAHLRLSVHPADVAIYLDGRLLGSGDELARLHSPLIVDPGEHVLQAVRPGYQSKEVTFEAVAGEEVELEIELEK